MIHTRRYPSPPAYDSHPPLSLFLLFLNSRLFTFTFMLLSDLHCIKFSVTVVNSNPNFSCNIPFSRSSLQIRHRFHCHCQRRRHGDWGSNAEAFRYKFQEEDLEFGDDFERLNEGSDGVLDKIWIFKVFKAYGYLLPGIIVSLLLATGLKAFLITLAISLSLSLISLASENTRGGVSSRPIIRARGNKKKKNPLRIKNSSKNSFQRQEKGKRNNYSERNGYKSWIYSTYFSEGDDAESRLRKYSFGGWDELDNEDTVKKSPLIQSKRKMKEGEPFKKGKQKDGEPLLLRLLIAVFPFLKSWPMIL